MMSNVDNTRQLEEAFEEFNRLSTRLGDNYRDLEKQVERLNAERKASRSQRILEFAAKEKLANRLDALIQVLPGGVLVLDSQAQLSEANPRGRDMLGVHPQNANWQQIFTDHSGPRKGQVQEILLADGRQLSIISSNLSEAAETVVLMTDVTDLEQLREMVNRKKRLAALGEMAADLAHQVRTPLSTALLYLSQLSQPELDDEIRIRLAGRVRDRICHLERLVNDMLNRVKGGVADQTSCSLWALLEDIENTLDPAIAQAGGELRLDLPGDDIYINGNSAALTSAIINICENAVQSIPKLLLELSVDADPQNVAIRISDNGPGVDEWIQDRIFDPFYTTRSEGTGLGLASAMMTAQAHGGNLTVRNRTLGGTEFTLQLARDGLEKGHPAISPNLYHTLCMEADG